MRRIAAVLVTALLLAGTAQPASAAPSTSRTETRYLARVLVLVNKARSEPRTCGTTRMKATAPLTRSARIDRVADRYAARMAKEHFFSHTAPDGSTMASRMRKAGFTAFVGENIAAGYATPRAVVDGWLKSPGHCVNLMRPGFHRIGLGYAKSAGSPYGTYWVQDFSS